MTGHTVPVHYPLA